MPSRDVQVQYADGGDLGRIQRQNSTAGTWGEFEYYFQSLRSVNGELTGLCETCARYRASYCGV
jgi:hypothetical protein